MIEKYLSQIGSRIKKIRSTLKVTQKEMATMSGLSLGFISEIENGKKRPSSIYLFFLANNYKVNINYILVGEGEMFATSSPPKDFKKKWSAQFGTYKEVIDELLFYMEEKKEAFYHQLSAFMDFKKNNTALVEIMDQKHQQQK